MLIWHSLYSPSLEGRVQLLTEDLLARVVLEEELGKGFVGSWVKKLDSVAEQDDINYLLVHCYSHPFVEEI